jgi:hypothetical protein
MLPTVAAGQDAPIGSTTREQLQMNTQITRTNTPSVTQRYGRLFGTRVATGAALIFAGGLLALQQMGYLHAVALSHSWPIIVIVLALVQIGSSLNAPRQRGWSLLLFGDWLFANTMTDWTYAQFTWPILLAGVGAVMIFRAIEQRRTGDRDQMHGSHYAT